MRPELRTFLRSPAFTVTAVLTIGLGVGVNIAVFALPQQVLLDPLHYRDPDRLVHTGQAHPGFPATQVSAPNFFDWARSATSFSGMAVSIRVPFRQLPLHQVSMNLGQ